MTKLFPQRRRLLLSFTHSLLFYSAVVIVVTTTTSAPIIHAFSAPGTFPSPSSLAKGLLDQEMYQAQARRAEVERALMERQVPKELPETKVGNKNSKKAGNKKGAGGGGGGAGFGATSSKTSKKWSKAEAMAEGLAQILEQDGVIRINNALSKETCQALRRHVLSEVDKTALLAKQNPNTFVNEDYYGIEPTRTSRTDLLLSFVPEPVAQAFEELFDSKTGKLRPLYEHLVTKDGIMYELACVTTSPGSNRQTLHPDLPYQDPAPLYVVFLALQDVTENMGPTTFLKGTNTAEATEAFNYVDPATGEKTALNELISSSEVVFATLNRGDLVVFDARTLHTGTANNADQDDDVNSSRERAMFNFSFRNPQVTGPLGYKGSMRPEYTRQEIRLSNILDVVDNKNNNNDNNTDDDAEQQGRFAHFGDGLPLR